MAAFNAAVRSKNFEPFIETLAPDAVLRFPGLPIGPYLGREAIATAYAERPPTDTMSVRSVRTEGDTDVVRFAWDAGGTGTMTVQWRGDLVATVSVTFD